MKHLLFILGFFPFVSINAQGNIQVFPETVTLSSYQNCKCQFDTLEVKSKIEEKNFSYESRSDQVSKFNFVDLNNDGDCEVVHKFSSSVRGWPYDFIMLYIISKEGSINKIGDFGSYFVSFAKPHDQWLQINETHFEGHKTNPTYYIRTLRFDGEKFKVAYSPKLTRGEFQDLALKAYKSEDYQTALTSFKNVLAFPNLSANEALASANDVAITMIKLGQSDEVEPYLMQFTKEAELKKVIASAYFNIGLAKENIPNASPLQAFQKSYLLNPTEAAKVKIKKYER